MNVILAIKLQLIFVQWIIVDKTNFIPTPAMVNSALGKINQLHY